MKHGLNRLLIIMMVSLFGTSCDQKSQTLLTNDQPSQELESSAQNPTEKISVSNEIDLTDEFQIHAVVAGVYSTLKASESKVDQLKQSGFANAEAIQRPGSKLYSTIVEKFDNQEAAKLFSDRLAKDYKIKSYVYNLTME